MGTKLYHLVPKICWHKLVSEKAEYFPPTYTQDGFIHLTKNPSLLLSVANHFYQEIPGAFQQLTECCVTVGLVHCTSTADFGVGYTHLLIAQSMFRGVCSTRD